eukprot:scaffold2988_cov123-Isochrysis_galbana.AAC.7
MSSHITPWPYPSYWPCGRWMSACVSVSVGTSAVGLSIHNEQFTQFMNFIVIRIRIPGLGLCCSTTCYNLEACVVLNGLRPTRRPQWRSLSLTALNCTGRNVPCNVEIKTPHYDHTTPELTVTPYRATSNLRSASVSAASVGKGVLFCFPGARGGSVKALDD